MQFVGFLLVVVMAALAFWGSSRNARWVRYVLAIAASLSFLGVCLLFLAPRNYMVRFPWTASVLHPWMLTLYTATALIIFCGFALGFLAGLVHRSARRRNGTRNC